MKPNFLTIVENEKLTELTERVETDLAKVHDVIGKLNKVIEDFWEHKVVPELRQYNDSHAKVSQLIDDIVNSRDAGCATCGDDTEEYDQYACAVLDRFGYKIEHGSYSRPILKPYSSTIVGTLNSLPR